MIPENSFFIIFIFSYVKIIETFSFIMVQDEEEEDPVMNYYKSTMNTLMESTNTIDKVSLGLLRESLR